jgi:PAS domain S-box-containing protein
MGAKNSNDARRKALRSRAEAAAPKPGPDVATPTVEESQKLIEELRVHQIELELQNQELREAELRVERERDRYASLYDLAPVGHLTLDWRGTIQEMNPIAVDMLGLERSRLVGTSLARYLNAQGKRALHVHLVRTRQAETPQGCELELMRPDGTSLHVYLQSIAVRRPDEPDTVCRTTLSDLTERTRAETLLRIQRDLALALSSVGSLSAALEQVLGAALRIEGIDCGGIYLVDEASGGLDLAVHAGLSRAFLGTESHFVNDTPHARLVTAGGGLYLSKTPHAYSDAALQREGVRTVASIPIKHGGRVLAALNAGSRTCDDFSASTRQALETIATQVGGVVARMRAEEALAGRTRQLETLMDNAPDGIARVDRQYRYVLVNRRWNELVCSSPKHVAEKNCCAPGSTAKVSDTWHSALARVFDTGQMHEVDLEVDGVHGPQPCQARLVPEFAPDGRVETVLSLVRDVTEQRSLQAELNQAQKMEVVGQLAAGIAHDVNNVLTAIGGYTTLARMRLQAGEGVSGHLEHVEEAVQDAGGIANALLAFTHKLPAEKRPVDLRATLHGAARLLRHVLPANIALVTDASEEPGVWVLGDRTQLQQMILNLAVNARDAMPNGGMLRLTLSNEGPPPGAVDAASAAEPVALAKLEVADTGSGVPPDVLPHIFEPFFTTKAVGIGTGLGLAIVKSGVEQHGGRIAVESRAGQGAVFTIRLPRIAPPAAPAAAPHALVAARGRGELILIAEDNRSVLQVLTACLRQSGYETVQATDASELLAQCARWQQRLRLLVVDIDLPKGNGLEALRRIRHELPTAPAVVITAKLDVDLEAVADARTRVLRKPFHLADFLRAAASLLAAYQGVELVS